MTSFLVTSLTGSLGLTVSALTGSSIVSALALTVSVLTASSLTVPVPPLSSAKSFTVVFTSL